MAQQPSCELEACQENHYSPNSLDVPVGDFLRRERTRQCPFCTRWMDCKVLSVHMNNCTSREASEESSTSSVNVETTLRIYPQNKRTRQCIFCKCWMDHKILIVHMRKFHGEEVVERPSDAKQTAAKKSRNETKGPGRKVNHELDEQNKRIAEVEKRCYDMKCPMCELQYTSQEDLVYHCRIGHGDRYCLVHQRRFRTEKEFEIWKNSMAKTYCTVWILSGRCRSDHRNDVVFYRCSRVSTGECYRDPSDETKPSVSNCTSFLKAYINDDGTVLARYCTQHLTHGLRVADLPLLKSEEKVVLDLLRQGYIAKDIRSRIREKYPSTTRLHWISNCDIKDIWARYNREQRRKNLMDMDDVSPETSLIDGSSRMQSDNDHVDVKTLIPTSPVEDGECYEDSTNSDDRNSYRRSDSPIPVELLLGCPTCAKLNEKVLELEATERRLMKRLAELEGSQLFVNTLKEEHT
uniref:C2H2-type domain-containing protein n=1 Tax=Haemonchus contortus TaxID=6289 RepID=A0A7I4YH71_HAECO